MRMSRVLLAGVAVAATAAATSAFTASNDVTDASVAGYDKATVTGATVDSIDYVLDGTDKTLLDSITFIATEDVSDREAWLLIEDGDGDPVAGGNVQCTAGAFSALAPAGTPIVCVVPDTLITDVVSVALTVAD